GKLVAELQRLLARLQALQLHFQPDVVFVRFERVDFADANAQLGKIDAEDGPLLGALLLQSPVRFAKGLQGPIIIYVRVMKKYVGGIILIDILGDQLQGTIFGPAHAVRASKLGEHDAGYAGAEGGKLYLKLVALAAELRVLPFRRGLVLD